MAILLLGATPKDPAYRSLLRQYPGDIVVAFNEDEEGPRPGSHRLTRNSHLVVGNFNKVEDIWGALGALPGNTKYELILLDAAVTKFIQWTRPILEALRSILNKNGVLLLPCCSRDSYLLGLPASQFFWLGPKATRPTKQQSPETLAFIRAGKLSQVKAADELAFPAISKRVVDHNASELKRYFKSVVLADRGYPITTYNGARWNPQYFIARA